MNDKVVILGRNLVILTIIYYIFTQATSLILLFNEYGEDVIQPQNMLPLLFRIGMPIVFSYLLFTGHNWVRWVLIVLLFLSGIYYLYLIIKSEGSLAWYIYIFSIGNIAVSYLLFTSRHIRNYIQFKDDEYMNASE
ncbi:hypothetical protein [Cohnella silvisoli]|uniref:DUF2069 domain-containing protein n=1 Tax=Cohnella silvisoli TaxID=2873699 RepID=A0ABV1KVR1_9BACL|nr:hypothetical protein [Cohnella silvisoli]MCD9023463.1 hypothetical protein [Cohnella silvisoli]